MGTPAYSRVKKHSSSTNPARDLNRSRIAANRGGDFSSRKRYRVLPSTTRAAATISAAAKTMTHSTAMARRRR